MARNGLYILLVVLGLTTLAARSEAQLGCFTESGPPFVATCVQASDCAPVGGTDCTAGGACFCPDGALAPLCACAAGQSVAPAPTLSPGGLIAVAGLLCAVGLFGMWRRTGGRRELS